MIETMHGTCWTEERAHAVLRSVALANDEAEFLAVHQPIRDFQVSTTTGRSIEASDEALLADLSDPETRYAFCVVEGEPGAGKSHLIRWLGVKWHSDDLVRRRPQSLSSMKPSKFRRRAGYSKRSTGATTSRSSISSASLSTACGTCSSNCARNC
jgi:hypothetical protein